MRQVTLRWVSVGDERERKYIQNVPVAKDSGEVVLEGFESEQDRQVPILR
jgi:hypothetical protein